MPLHRFLPFLPPLLILLLCCGCRPGERTRLRTDVCILGGSEAGFTAALQAARMGRRVILLEPTGHAGGMIVEGLGKDIRFGSARVIGGIAREFYRAVEARYRLTANFNDPKWYSRYEPSVAESVIDSLLAAETNIRVIRHQRIREEGGVVKSGTTLKTVTLENGVTIAARVFVDASIEGHLLHFAGVTTATIREGNARYGETLNGVQIVNDFKQFSVRVDPYRVPGDSSSGLIPTIQDGPLGAYGAPSKYIQGFCFRMCLTRTAGNTLPVPRPANYRPDRYEIYRRYLAAGGRLFRPRVNRHGGKTDLGSWHDLSANLYGENWAYPRGSYRVQDSLVAYHRDFTQGLIWFLQNDPGVDSLTRAEWAGWGLPKDEFTDNGHWPRRLYVRSARRMVSDYLITEKNSDPAVADTVTTPIAVAWWPPDVHHARRLVVAGAAYNEGFTHVTNKKAWRPFKIAYRAAVPRAAECTNLLSPTCLSSSYVGYGSIRIAPTFLVLGQSVGAAAALAVAEDLPVQRVPYSRLRPVLNQGGQILAPPEDWRRVIEQNN